nr:ninja-family protein afp2 [Quercus suber]
MSSNTQKQKSNEEEEEEDSEEIELNLGLSLGGRFGVDKSKKKLIRSSSIDMSYRNTIDVSYRTNTTVLTRTSSLPTETEEEWRKRKELQTLRRMAAKRRRSEKQRSCKAEREEERKEIESPMGLNLRDRQQSLSLPVAMANRLNSTLSLPFGMPSWESNKRLQAQGLSTCGEARSSASNQSLQERSNQEAVGSSSTKANENLCRNSTAEMDSPSKKPDHVENRVKEAGMNAMEDMPCVFTKGDGPNGRRVDGILYKYGKGEEVRIMCVCHGTFLSPAEFVKHAGGGDVTHPLRHIVINPSSTSFL